MNWFKVLLVVGVSTLISSVWGQDTKVVNEERFTLRVNSFYNFQELHLKGSFRYFDTYYSKEIRRSIEKDKNIVLFLDFKGGNLESIETFAKIVKSKCKGEECLIRTVVQNGKKCNSYCMVLFMLGSERLAEPVANFGFHAATLYELVGDEIVNEELSPETMEEVLLDVGVSKDWLNKNKKIISTPFINTLAPRELSGSNIITDIITEPVYYGAFPLTLK